MHFRIGDEVIVKSESSSRKGKITKIVVGEKNEFFVVNSKLCMAEELEHSGDFELEELIEVSNFYGFSDSFARKFLMKHDKLRSPYIVSPSPDNSVESWKYARKLREYSPFREFDDDWIGQEVMDDENVYQIVGFNGVGGWKYICALKSGPVKRKEICLFSLIDAAEKLRWRSTGLPFGVEREE